MRGILVFLGMVVPGSGIVQKVPPLSLKPANATLEEEFTAITSIRELSDGRVIITDPRDKGLVVADLKTGKVEPISRKGQGPSEYSTAAPILALRGDSSLMSDVMSRR